MIASSNRASRKALRKTASSAKTANSKPMEQAQLTVKSMAKRRSIGSATFAAQWRFSSALGLPISAKDAMMVAGTKRTKLRIVAESIALLVCRIRRQGKMSNCQLSLLAAVFVEVSG